MKEKIPIVILHGWSRVISGARYAELKKLLEKKGYRVFAPDLPGFGKEPLKKMAMNVDDYLEFVHLFLEKNKLKNVVLIGHSFGGRIAVKFSYKYPDYIAKLILTGAPLIKEPLSAKKRVLSFIAKLGKGLLSSAPNSVKSFSRKMLYKSIGEWDYYKAGQLRNTFQNIIQEDLAGILTKISVPTLIIWGEYDSLVPSRIGLRIGRLIKDSEFKIIPGTHRLPYENSSGFFKAIEHFLP